MTDGRYDKLDRIRADIEKDRKKVLKLQEQIKLKEAKLKDAEASQIVADVTAMNMSPEQLGAFLELIESGKLEAYMNKQKDFTNKTNDYSESDEDEEIEEDMEDIEDDKN